MTIPTDAAAIPGTPAPDEEDEVVQCLVPAVGGMPLTVTVPAGADGERLDRLLADAGTGLSRSRLKALIGDGRVSAAGRILSDPAQRVKPGQIFAILVPDPEPAIPIAQDLPLTIVYEDDDVLVIDKAADMVVHPAAGNPDGTLVNALLHHCGASLSGIGGVRRPGIVHRLDKGTSGLMVVAKNDRAHQALAAQFQDRSLSRRYRAVTWGVPSPAEGEIDGAIGRHPTDRLRMAMLAAGGKPALTRYRTLRPFAAAAALIECRLQTGRTHQIRVHMAAIGHPLVGDPLYGGRGGRPGAGRGAGLAEPTRHALVGFPRQALHAAALRFRHPADGRIARFVSEPPRDFLDLVETLSAV